MSGNDSKLNDSGVGEGDSIQVFVRTRPTLSEGGEHAMCLDTDCSRNTVIMHSKPEPKRFTFDHVADMSVTQETVFTTVGKKVIDSCINGYNGTIFAYGQTGSGKTFTMIGPSENCDNFQHELRGVIPRSFEYLFMLINREMELHGDNVKFLTKCSFLEIYNEQIFDLLDEASNGLHLRENIKKGVFVDGLIENAVNNAAEAYDVLSTGWMNRTVASTSMNRESSRSHAVFALSIESKTLKNGVWTMKASQLNLVDLAGSERQKDSHTTGVRLKEAGSINKSLSVLGNVIMSLVDIAHGKTRHVPYRDSKLSFLLRDSLGGNTKTCIIACIHPGAKCFGETMSTLLFARRAKMIKNKAIVNEDAQGSVSHLQVEIKRLKEMIQRLQAATPIAAELGTPVVAMQSVEGSATDSNMRRCFLQAMLLREKVLHEKQVVENKLAVSEGKVEKMDKQLRSKEMVLKFRTNALKVYESAKKQMRDLNTEEKDIIITNLQDQGTQLQEQITHHPSLGKYKLENDQLRAENAQLKCSRSSVDEMDWQRGVELEKIHQKLLEEDAEETGEVYRTPQPVDDAVASATLHRHKSQTEQLSQQLQQLQSESKTDKETHEKELIKSRSELDSWKTRYDELAAVQKSQYITGQIEREERDRLHMETIKNMTPKKYNLRNRTVVAAFDSNEMSFSLEDSMLGEGGDILLEERPQEMYETLEEELKKNREENSQFHKKVEERDSQLVDKTSEISRLLSESNQLKEILEKERADWSITSNQHRDDMHKYKKESLQLQDDNERLDETKKDMDLIMIGMEKNIKELRKERDALTHEKQTCLSELSTKVMQLENEKVKLETHYAYTVQECEKLREEAEVAQSNTLYMESQITYAEEKISQKEAEIKQDKAIYNNLLLKLERSEEEREQVLDQLQKYTSEAGDKQREIITLMESKKTIETQYDNVCQELNQTRQSLSTAQDELNSKTEENKKLTKMEKELREVYQSLCTKNCELKQLYVNSQDTEAALEGQLRESVEREESLHKEVEGKCVKVKEQNVVIIEKEGDIIALDAQLQRKKAEYDLQQDDLDCVLKENDELKECLDNIKIEKDQLSKQVGEKSSRCIDLSNSLDSKINECEMVQSNLRDLKLEKEKLVENIDKQHAEIKHLRNDYDQLKNSNITHIDSLKTNQQELIEKQSKLNEYQHQIDYYSLQMQEKQILIDELQNKVKEKCESVEMFKRNQELLQSQLSDLNSRFQATIDDRDKKASELTQLQEKQVSWESVQNELQFAVHQAREVEESLFESKSQERSLKEQMDVLKGQKENIEAQLSAVNQMTEDQKKQVYDSEAETARLRGIIEQNSRQVDVVMSQLNQQREENLKLTKKNEELNEEIVRIGSHANHQQKISMLHKRTQEVNQLTEELNHANHRIARLMAHGVELRHTPSKDHTDRDKENTTPLREQNVHSSLLQKNPT